jgi:CBS domain-containing protein
MHVQEIMSHRTEAVQVDDSVQDAAKHMKTFGIGILPVVNEDGVAGVLTDRDLVTRVMVDGKDPGDTRVKDVMTTRPIAVYQDQEVADAARAMMGHRIRRLIVLDRDGERTGIVSIDDMCRDLRCAPFVQEVMASLASGAETPFAG